MKKIISFLSLMTIITVLFFTNIEVKSGPFGKCGALIDTSELNEECIYHFFKCDCIVGTVIIREEEIEKTEK